MGGILLALGSKTAAAAALMGRILFLYAGSLATPRGEREAWGRGEAVVVPEMMLAAFLFLCTGLPARPLPSTAHEVKEEPLSALHWKRRSGTRKGSGGFKHRNPSLPLVEWPAAERSHRRTTTRCAVMMSVRRM
jgi:hypothetical protein